MGGIGEINFGKQFRQGNRVYDSNAVAMCLTAQPLGNAGGYSYLYKVDESFTQPQTRGTCPTPCGLGRDGDTEHQIICCVAMRGRYNENGKAEQHLEPRFDGVTNTITTVSKDNLILEHLNIQEV